MSSSARANLGCVVRAGESYQGKQGPNYTPGISAQSAGSQAIWLGSGTLAAHGGRTKAHLHENHESAIYLLSGDEVELCAEAVCRNMAGTTTSHTARGGTSWPTRSRASSWAPGISFASATALP